MNSITSLTKLKQASPNTKYVAIFGKTFVDRDEVEYEDVKSFASTVIEANFGIIHGGYIGLMEAASIGANEAIESLKLSPNLNIGVPEKRFDDNGVIRSKAIHTEPAEGIMERVATLVEGADIAVVARKGGFGTLLESVAIFHQNQLNKKFGGKVIPIVFVGLHWKDLFSNIAKGLDMKNQDTLDEHTFFVSNYKEALEIITKVK